MVFNTGEVDDKNIQKSLACSYCTKIFCVFFKKLKKSGRKYEFFFVCSLKNRKNTQKFFCMFF